MSFRPIESILNRRRFLRHASAIALGSGLADILSAKDRDAEDVHEYVRRLAEDAPLRMKFQGETQQDCQDWQQRFRAKLAALLGPHKPPINWQAKVEDVAEFEDHRRATLLLTADGHPTLPVHVRTPKPAGDKPLPAVVAIHGHGDYGYDPVAGRDELPGVDKAIASANYDYGRQLVRRGYVVACPCLTPFGRRLDGREAYGGGDPCGVSFVRLQLLGKVLMAENLRDCLWAFELLARHESVDASRIGCAGLSYGGRMTMLTAAMEPRVRVACVSGALNLMQERVAARYSCGAQVIPGLLEYGDVPEIGSLLAPRPCVWETGTQDALIKPDWAERAMRRMQRAYAACGAEANLVRDQFAGGHRWNGAVSFPLFARELGGRA